MNFETLKTALNAVTTPHGLTPEYDEVIITCGAVYDDQYDRPTITGIFYGRAGQPVTPDELLAAAWPFVNTAGIDSLDSRLFEPLTLDDQASYRVHHALVAAARPYVSPGQTASAVRFTSGGLERLHCPTLHSTFSSVHATHVVRMDAATYTGSAQEITAQLAGSGDLLLRHFGQMTRLMIPVETARFALAREFLADVRRLHLGIPVTHDEQAYLLTTDYAGSDVGLLHMTTGEYGRYIYHYHPSRPRYMRDASAPASFPEEIEHDEQTQRQLNCKVMPARIERQNRRYGLPKPVRLGDVQAAPSLRASITSNLDSTVLLRFPDGEIFSLEMRFKKPLPIGETRPLQVLPYDVTRQTEGRNELCLTQLGETLVIKHLDGEHVLNAAQVRALTALVNCMERRRVGGANFPLERAWGLTFGGYTNLRAPYFSAYYDPKTRIVNFRGQFDQPSSGTPKDVCVSLAEAQAAAAALTPSDIGGYRLPAHLARHVIGNITLA